MNDDDRVRLEQDAARGERYAAAWDDLIEPFFARKDKELYRAFKETASSNHKGLSEIRMQSNALEALKEEFQHFINTGRMANMTIDEEDNNDG